MSDKKKAPRIFGFLLTLLGLALFGGGVRIFLMGGGFYFIIVGAGVAISGFLITRGHKSGAYLYLFTLAVIIAWSLFEVGIDFKRLLPRISIPTLIALYIFSKRIQDRLD